MFLECIEDIKEYNIYKGSLWRVINNFPKVYYIEIENYKGERFIVNEKYSFNFKFLG